jgi:DNA/RNA endonuclease YhcR with UshA esterase domain
MKSVVAGTVLLLSVVCTLPALFAQTQEISAVQAANHIGEQAVVCGLVASAKFATRSKGTPTFINLDEPYPNEVFTALIWGEDRQKFERPEDALLGKRICVSGVVQSYRGTPEVIVRTRSQIRIQGQ